MHFVEKFNLPEKAMLSEKPFLHPTSVIDRCSFGSYTEVMAFTNLSECTVDDFSYLCEYCQANFTQIGKFANIAAMCRINPGFHPMERPTLHHFTYRMDRYGFDKDADEAFFEWRRVQKVTIGHDTWIGHGVVIMPGVKIGNGAVVGSNSVVTKDVPSYTIAAGSPAKIIRKRFPDDISDAIESTAWWNWDYNTIKERLPDFRDLRTFLWKYA